MSLQINHPDDSVRKKKDEIKSQAGPVGGLQEPRTSMPHLDSQSEGDVARGAHTQTQEAETLFTCFQHRSFDDGPQRGDVGAATASDVNVICLKKSIS